MGRKRTAVLGAVVALTATAAVAEDLVRVESKVYETPGSPEEIARKAGVCIGRIVKPGFTTAPTIISADYESGVIVANAAFKYLETIILPRSTSARARMTFEARPGRFRMTFTEIEGFSTTTRTYGGWNPIRKPKYHDPAGAEATMRVIADEVAKCVTAPAEDW